MHNGTVNMEKYTALNALALWRGHNYIAQVWTEHEARKKANKKGDYILRNAKGIEITRFSIT